jgi:hypothetical protein
MADTLHRPPAKGEVRDELRFLHGIDLERVHRRPPRFDRRWIFLAIAVAIVTAAVVVAVLVTRGGTELEEAAQPPVVPEATEALPAPRLTAPNRPAATDQLVPDLAGLPIPATVPVTAPNRPATTDQLVPDLAGLPIAPTSTVRPEPSGRPRATDLIVIDQAGFAAQHEDLAPGIRPREADLIVLDTAGLPAIVPSAPGTAGGFLPI